MTFNAYVLIRMENIWQCMYVKYIKFNTFKYRVDTKTTKYLPFCFVVRVNIL